MQRIVIGARGSQLSLIQTDIIREKLRNIFPETDITVKIIKTTGDKNMNPVPLDSIGKGWFTKEIDRALLREEIDLAVHSLKDLPEILPDGLIIAAIPEREDAREVLVSKKGLQLSDLPSGAIIGTDSARRQSQLLSLRPDFVINSIRGNVNTRLKKLFEENYDALVLAAAGLLRLGVTEKITQYFSPVAFIPSPGQGALAVVIKQSNTKLKEIVTGVNHAPTVNLVMAERAFSSAIGGGCKQPVGAYAALEGKKLVIHGFVGSLDGKQIERDVVKGDAAKGITLGRELAEKLLQKSKSWYRV